MNQLPLEKMKLAANTIRTLSMDAVQRANSGHPGTPMALADVAVVLWSQFLQHDPTDPLWPNRDRFVLSPGHASMLLYSLLHLSGYALTLDDLRDFRQWQSKTPGHPEHGHTEGVEITTGPLGQGISSAVGMALAERWLAQHFNRPGFELIDHYTYAIASDGDIMEGISHEASALASHWGLHKLIVFYDDNRITIDGTTELSLSEDVPARYRAYGWHTLTVEDGHDMSALHAAIVQARAEHERPTLITIKTHIGYGSPHKQDTSSAHGSPLGDDEIALTKAVYGWDHPPFFVPEEAVALMTPDADALAERQEAWADLFQNYEELHPELAAQFSEAFSGDLPADWEAYLPHFDLGKAMATRVASGKVLEAIMPHLPLVLGGSADLTGSVKTMTSTMHAIKRGDFSGQYIHFGIREHGMAAIMNGMVLHGGLRVYGGTFLVFSDYLRPSLRLAALMNLPVIHVLTHDSIGLGEDGPTHQPIEHLMALRAMPNLHVVRPADANETAVAWQHALNRKDGPTALVLTRQNLATLDGPTENARRGAYVLRDVDNPQAIILATGSEVEIAVAAQKQLLEEGIPARVVSMPCWEQFEADSAEYRASVLPPHITARVAIEAGVTFGWERYVGQWGKTIGIDHFGASAPYETLYEEFGLTSAAVVAAVKELSG